MLFFAAAQGSLTACKDLHVLEVLSVTDDSCCTIIQAEIPFTSRVYSRVMSVVIAHHARACDWFNFTLATIPNPEWLIVLRCA